MTSSDQIEIHSELKREKLELLKKQVELRRDLPHLYGWKLYKWQREFIETTNRDAFITAANQVGKACLNKSTIITPTGPRIFGDLKVGDEVFGRDGKPTKVTQIFEVKDKPFYKITFNDQTSTVACGEHRWVAKDSTRRFRKSYTKGTKKWENPTYDQWSVYTTDEMIKLGKYSPLPKSNYTKFSIPICEAVEYQEKDLILEPYFLGLLIGDGSLATTSSTISKADKEVCDYLVAHGCVKRADKFTYGIPASVRSKYTTLGLFGTYSNTKFIPEIYLQGSVAQRKDLLAGLMDTDGTVTEAHVMEYNTSSPQLAKDFIRLVCSLGGTAEHRIRSSHYVNPDGEKIDCQDSHRIYVKTLFNPFRLKRKADRWKVVEKYKHERVVDSIEPLGQMDGRCIMVDNADHTYLIEDTHIVTHNSSCQILKVITWATSPELWPSLWRKKPSQFWYLYPTKDVASIEFETKWKKDFLPKGDYKNHPIYGWREEKKGRGDIFALHFNSGVSIYFKTYAQDVTHLQSSTCDYISTDEELPENLYDELNFRRNATDGYFSMVFTATLGQELWRLTMERKPGETEKFPSAWKRQISLFDCMKFEDGTPSHWTNDKIARTIASCRNDAEVQRRVYGKFVISEGLKYGGFTRAGNVVRPHDIPSDWLHFVGVDIGAGGDKNHPSAISFIAVKPDYSYGCVYRHWRGDEEITTMSDVANKYLELRLNTPITGAYYDYHARDFKTITDRMGLSFMAAEKRHDIGEQVINTLFKNKMLVIFDTPENEPIIRELSTLILGQDKRQAKDDSVDSMRYGITNIPWDWTKAEVDPLYRPPGPEVQLSPTDYADKQRMQDAKRMFDRNFQDDINSSIERELDAWGEMYDV